MRTGIVFPGQGSQYVGMGQSLMENFPIARETFEEADEQLGFSLSQICFEGPEEDLRLTYYTQPALLATSVAAYRVLVDRVGAMPVVAAGHSLGEYAALVAVGAMTFGDAVRVVHHRGRLMDDAVPAGEGAMAAVLGMSEEALTDICQHITQTIGEVVELANINCPGQIAISGTVAGVSQACDRAKASGAKRAILLNVSGPFHSSLMKPAAKAFGSVLDDTKISTITTPVVSNVDGQARTNANDLRDALKRQLYSPVRWIDDVETMKSIGVDIILELGPGKVLSGLIRKIDKGIQTNHVEDEPTLQDVAKLFDE